MSTSLTSLTTNYFPSAQNGFTTTLASTISSGAATVPLNSVAGYSNGQIAVFVVDPSDAAKKQTFTGVVDTAGVQITSVVWTAGTNQTHTAGSTVVDYATATHISMMTKGISIAHDQAGIHKSGASYPSPAISGTVSGGATYSAPVLASPTMTTRFDGWVTGLTAPNTVTYNGNRNYSLVFNSLDLTGLISNGHRLRLTRTVTAPTQCTSLNGTTQYYSKSSPAGMTFTTTFSAMAWVKLSSYAAGMIISRHNGTNGWLFFFNATGQLQVQIGTGSANTSYQSLPLNKWVHVAASYSSGTVLLYIDGILVTGTGTPSVSITQAGSLEVGSYSGGLNPFPGKIAQAAVFSAVISQATIQSYIAQGLAGTETSLVSAYSFNNSINDLNANANNLTANGSAVATNVDSPFAGGVSAPYTAGTTEFGEVFNVSFSTNTTVVVQVPDGYAIPTSGGVSAVAYSGQFNPLGWPSPVVRLGYAQISANDTTGGTAQADINGLTTTVYVPSGRRIKITSFANMYNQSVANAYQILWVKEGSTNISNVASGESAANQVNGASGVVELWPTSGSHTYKLAFQASGGAKAIEATATEPAFIMVELV